MNTLKKTNINRDFMAQVSCSDTRKVKGMKNLRYDSRNNPQIILNQSQHQGNPTHK